MAEPAPGLPEAGILTMCVISLPDATKSWSSLVSSVTATETVVAAVGAGVAVTVTVKVAAVPSVTGEVPGQS